MKLKEKICVLSNKEWVHFLRDYMFSCFLPALAILLALFFVAAVVTVATGGIVGFLDLIVYLRAFLILGLCGMAFSAAAFFYHSRNYVRKNSKKDHKMAEELNK